MQLAVGRVYRAKKPQPAGIGLSQYFNDRKVTWIDGELVQYESPASSTRRHPTMSRKAFEEWACRDVTNQLPKDAWQAWGGDE